MYEMLEILEAEIQSTMTLPWQVVLARILGSVFLTGLIGIEREAHSHAAGLRTHMLVGMAATCYCLITLKVVAWEQGSDVRMDPLRLVEAVTGGVAFLAAGLIVFARGEVQGLTTGASLWLSASIGLAVGIGLWPLAAAVTFFGLVIVWLLRVVERSLKLGEE
jgi:putative Mg2+ transporter-C (MgtC) family protein